VGIQLAFKVNFLLASIVYCYEGIRKHEMDMFILNSSFSCGHNGAFFGDVVGDGRSFATASSGSVGTRWPSRKLAGSIPMVSLEFFIDTILPAALWSTQPLTEMSTRNISWVVKTVGA